MDPHQTLVTFQSTFESRQEWLTNIELLHAWLMQTGGLASRRATPRYDYSMDLALARRTNFATLEELSWDVMAVELP